MTRGQWLEAGTVTSPRGFSAAGVACGIKRGGALDLALIASDRDCAAAGVFTTNRVKAAPVLLNQAVLQESPGAIRAVVANSGNANAMTGEPGLRDARAMQALAADALGVSPAAVLVLSTGVIGVPLPMPRLRAGMPEAARHLSDDGGIRAAQAIMTTDTRPKHAAIRVKLSGGTVTLGGIVKGAGMIAPNMATMLAVLTTDLACAPHALHAHLLTAVAVSFNRIVVDGDMSTNDTVLLLANGASGVTIASEADAAVFQAALNMLATRLAQAVVRDGEGATRFVTVEVVGAGDEAAAAAIAQAIARSPLVKTAFAGGDANWGRIVCAAGAAGVALDPNAVSLSFSAWGTPGLVVVQDGTPARYAEADAAAIFAQPEFALRLSVGDGAGRATVWTCDLSHDYVSINADYRS